MNQKTFKYEKRNGKKIRIKDLLMLFSVFTLCIVTVIVSGTAVNKKLKANKDISEEETVTNVKSEINLHEVSKKSDISDLSNQETVSIQENFEFIKPVDGGIIRPFSPDELLYSETMDDWRTHMGIDISCPYGSDVVSIEKGVVKDVEYNLNLGNTITIQTSQYEHIYSSMSPDVYVKVGQSVEKGEVIGITSDTCISEICDDPHLHFEIKMDGVHINPLDLIDFN